MSIHKNNKHSLIAFIILFEGLAAIGANLEIYPLEPVVVPVPYQTNHLNVDFCTNVVISCPSGVVITNKLGRIHLLGVSNGDSIFLLIIPRTNYFCSPGTYQVKVEEALNTVTVLPPVGQDANVVLVLENTTLYEIMYNTGRGELSDKLKNICQQIMNLSPTGRYSVYAKAYLAVDSMYSALEALYGKPTAPDFSAIGGEMVALPVPENHLKWMVLFNKATAFGIRRDTQNARASYMTLTNGIQNSAWSYTAEKYLLSTQ